MSALQLYGELPSWPVVFAACDSRYFMEHAPAFVYSADAAGSDIHLHVVNPSPEVLSLAGILNATTERRLTYSFNDLPPGLTPEEARTYYACLRFLVLPSLLPKAGKVLVLDIDCLVMQALSLPDKPCGFFPRTAVGSDAHWLREASKVAAGVVYMTDEALNVADAVAQTITHEAGGRPDGDDGLRRQEEAARRGREAAGRGAVGGGRDRGRRRRRHGGGARARACDANDD